MTLTVVLCLFSCLIFFMMWASYPWSLGETVTQGTIETVEPVEMLDISESPSVIKILTWNLGFLYGEGSEGPGYVAQEEIFYQEKLTEMVKQLKAWNPDILCLQEIDFDSKRSRFLNQAHFIAKNAGYPYVAEAVSWRANYIPFPYWPFTRHFGSMKSGGAVLSKYPILQNEVTLLAKPMSQAWWYNLFYLHRYFQKVTVELGTKKFEIMNLHLEAFDKVDRRGQVKKLVAKIQNDKVDFVAGDFNSVPTSASKRSKFFNDDDYENDPSQDIMSKSGMLEVIPEEIYSKAENLYFTFPSSKPDRRLDYIFYRPDLKMMRAEIHPSGTSDHLPLEAIFQIDSPRFNPFAQ